MNAGEDGASHGVIASFTAHDGANVHVRASLRRKQGTSAMIGLAHDPPECSPPSRDASIEGVLLAAEETLEAIGIECNFTDRRRR